MLYSPNTLGLATQLLVIYSSETFALEHQEIGNSSTVYHNPKVETTQISIFRSMDKYRGVTGHNRALSMNERQLHTST